MDRAPAIVVALAGVLALAACGGPANQPPEHEPPTEISGNMGPHVGGVTTIYAAWAGLHPESVVYTSALSDTGDFHFDLSHPPGFNVDLSCNGINFTGAGIFAIWHSWDGEPTDYLPGPPRTFTTAVLASAPGSTVAVVWIFSPAAQDFPSGCGTGIASSIPVPMGWSTLGFDFDRDLWTALPAIPASATWQVQTFCVPGCPAADGTGKLD